MFWNNCSILVAKIKEQWSHEMLKAKKTPRIKLIDFDRAWVVVYVTLTCKRNKCCIMYYYVLFLLSKSKE